jgi:hypothetical protein
MGKRGRGGEREEEGGPLSFLRLDPNAASMTLYDLFANGKTKSRALVFVPGVKPLENNEYPPGKLRVQPDPIIPDG